MMSEGSGMGGWSGGNNGVDAGQLTDLVASDRNSAVTMIWIMRRLVEMECGKLRAISSNQDVHVVVSEQKLR